MAGMWLLLLSLALGVATPSPEMPAAPGPPPAGVPFDYQIGGDYEPAPGVGIVVRDWFEGEAPTDMYAICYVNAFQTQADDATLERPDERSAWPPELVLTELGDDPEWGGEYLVDLSTGETRAAAAAWIEPMVANCAEKGFEAVEFDNLDSWTRFQGTPLAGEVPFKRTDAVAYATELVRLAHDHGLAAAQKNTPQLAGNASRGRIGFDFAIAEECGRYRECDAYREVFGEAVLMVEYRARDFGRSCRQQGGEVPVILRDRLVSRRDERGYVYRACTPD